MINSLYIKDFALIDELETTFEPGLNIITGETGAGKSIIVGALNIILGERAQTESIREGANKAIAEAILKVGPDAILESIFEEHDLGFGQEVILRREVRHSGSRAFVNDTPVGLNVLRQIGERLVDLHGQHDHQLLLREEHHREVIDHREAVVPALGAYQKAWKEADTLRKKKTELLKKERDFQEKQDLYRFQLKEIRALDLKSEEENELEQEMRLLDGAEELTQKTGLILDSGREGDANALEFIRLMEQSLWDIARIEPEFESYIQELKTARISIEELLNFTEQYQGSIEFNPERLDFIRRRQTEIRRVTRKYGKSPEELIEFQQELESFVNLADNFELEIEKTDRQIAESTKKLHDAAVQLHGVRISESEALSEEIEKELMRLGFTHAQFEVKVDYRFESGGWISIDGEAVGCHFDGPDHVEFFISTNKGESPKPLSKTASGGEISRIMLALKSILARRQRLPVMIFDEIDTGISGPVALQVGRTMRELSEHCQILSITHLPQIAGMGHTHYVVEKKETADRTITIIRKLNDEQHIQEIAKLMSGSSISDSALESAREMVKAVQ